MKIAVITGASSGMGQESAIGLWEQFSGLDEIWAVGRRKDRLEKLEEKANIPVRKFALDLSQEKEREILKAELERLKPQVKFLVNAAGFGKIGNFNPGRIPLIADAHTADHRHTGFPRFFDESQFPRNRINCVNHIVAIFQKMIRIARQIETIVRIDL